MESDTAEKDRRERMAIREVSAPLLSDSINIKTVMLDIDQNKLILMFIECTALTKHTYDKGIYIFSQIDEKLRGW